MNKAILVGNLGRDPEIRYTPNGIAVANFSLATSESWRDKSGEKQTRTEWHKVVFFGKVAEVIGEYLTKGSKIAMEGKIQTRDWEDKEGVKRYTTEIVGSSMEMLGSKGGNGGGKRAYHDDNYAERNSRSSGFQADSGVDDDIPF